MNSDTRILNSTIRFETLNAYTSSSVTDINTSQKQNEQRHKQDKRVRKELDTQMLDDLYEPIQKTFLHNSKLLNSKNVDISFGGNEIITTGMWNCNYNERC
ncbi:7045_t:CDS:2 [Racocetra fulgida]|uniref:7045_t:CDS:1 n=1 Tax=Racocetra fulgida TaxID=60492 RepID=A0A9N8YUQ9_9GLOM|nr:7045_t:CDS:2 [Racocetra fulgida]